MKGTSWVMFFFNLSSLFLSMLLCTSFHATPSSSLNDPKSNQLFNPWFSAFIVPKVTRGMNLHKAN